jgi:hypothetical protein
VDSLRREASSHLRADAGGELPLRERVDIDAKSALAVLADVALELAPPEVTSRGFRHYFVELAGQGKLFFLDGEDERQFKLLVVVDEDVSDLPSHRFARVSGSFVLPIPSGELLVTDGGARDRGEATTLAIPPGNYAVSVLGLDAASGLDGPAFDAEQIDAVGAAGWRYHQRVDWLAPLGCLPLLAAGMVILIYRWSFVSLIAGLVGVLGLLPHSILKRTPRYRRIEGRLKDLEESQPHFALELRKVESVDGLVGGHHVVG